MSGDRNGKVEPIAKRSNEMATPPPRAVRAWSRLHARLNRLTRGGFMPRWFGAPVLGLETVGRRSGKPRATAILYLAGGDAPAVYAANAGAPRTPSRWRSLREAGEGTTVLRGKRTRVRARVLEGGERAEAFERFCEMFPQAREYPSFTERPMPLIALEPA